ncbi:hypothetical protein ABFG93_00600 [Pseudalkalibacillus hwajinpoensis]|uniref:hypothetical protein n=1 Tax=Guptibacillus hwajinpoensis TaxID=208199 RepID=UPI00325BCC35
MKGLFVVGVLIVFWVVFGLKGDRLLKDPPFVMDEDDIATMSGYNHVHAIMEKEELVRLDIYDQTKQLIKTYTPSQLGELYPSGSFQSLISDNDRFYLVYKQDNDIEVKKRIVVGARGSLTFMPERY